MRIQRTSERDERERQRQATSEQVGISVYNKYKVPVFSCTAEKEGAS